MRKESLIEYLKFKFRFEIFLAEERLISLRDLNCAGISKPKALAARLGLKVRTIENLQSACDASGLLFPITAHP